MIRCNNKIYLKLDFPVIGGVEMCAGVPLSSAKKEIDSCFTARLLM